MIVTVQAQVVRLVRQRDHARLSGAIAKAWQQPTGFTDEHWQRFVRAVHVHDDGWGNEVDVAKIGRNGLPHAFKQIDGDTHHEIWLRSIDIARKVDPYAGLLVALHSRHLEISFGERDASTQKFIGQLTRIVAELLDELRKNDSHVIDPILLDDARELLLHMDGISLMLLGGINWIDKTQPLAFGDVNQSVQFDRRADGCQVEPWPLAVEALECEVPYYEAQRSSLNDDAALRSLLTEQPTGFVTLKLKRQP